MYMAANAFGKSTIELWLIITQHVCGWCDAATKPIFIIPFCTSIDVASHFHIFVSPGGRGLYEYFDFFFSLFVCCCGCFVILTARNVLICTDMSGIFFLLFVVFVRVAVEMLTTLSYQSYFCDGGGGGGCKCDQCWAIIEQEKKYKKICCVLTEASGDCGDGGGGNKDLFLSPSVCDELLRLKESFVVYLYFEISTIL